MTTNDDQTIATEDTNSESTQVHEVDVLDDEDDGDDEDLVAQADDEATDTKDVGKDITMGVSWSMGAGSQSSETAVLVARKVADVVLLLLISVALAIAITVTLLVGASWGWNFVWNAIRG